MLGLITALVVGGGCATAQTGHLAALHNERGLQLLALTDAVRPTLRVVVPGTRTHRPVHRDSCSRTRHG